MSEPTLAVVIPSYGRLHRLPPLVRAYRAQGADQIVVVLDGPHPGWERVFGAVLNEPSGDAWDDDGDVVVVELPENVGLARARIAGLAATRTDLVLAVDDDVEPAPGLVARHREFHRTRRDAVLLGYMPVTLPARRGRDESPTFLYARDYERQARVWDAGDSPAILGSLWGGNVSLSRKLYLRAENLLPSERLEYNEDLDLGLRLIRVGASASFDREARAAHHHSRGFDAYARECLARGGAIAHLERRWGERPPQLAPLLVIPDSYSRVLGAVQRGIADRDRRGAVEAALQGLYCAAGVVRAWRVQDAIARLLRRALAMRGYRLATRDDKALVGAGLA